MKTSPYVITRQLIQNSSRHLSCIILEIKRLVNIVPDLEGGRLDDPADGGSEGGDGRDGGQIAQHGVDDAPVLHGPPHLNFERGEVGKQIFLRLGGYGIIPFEN